MRDVRGCTSRGGERTWGGRKGGASGAAEARQTFHPAGGPFVGCFFLPSLTSLVNKACGDVVGSDWARRALAVAYEEMQPCQSLISHSTVTSTRPVERGRDAAWGKSPLPR